MTYKRLRDERKRLGLYIQIEAAEELGVDCRWLKRHQDQFPPTHRSGKLLCYDQSDLDRIRAFLNMPPPTRKSAKRDRLVAQGYLSIKSAAKETGIPLVTWSKALQQGRVPKPSHRIGVRWYYTMVEAEEIAEIFRDNKARKGTFTVVQLASRLGISRWTLYRYLKRWPEIGVKVHLRRNRYTTADAEELERRLAAEAKLSTHPQPPPGMYSYDDVAKRFNLTPKQVRNKYHYEQLKLGIIQNGRRYFTLEEVCRMRVAFGLPDPEPKLL